LPPHRPGLFVLPVFVLDLPPRPLLIKPYRLAFSLFHVLANFIYESMVESRMVEFECSSNGTNSSIRSIFSTSSLLYYSIKSFNFMYPPPTRTNRNSFCSILIIILLLPNIYTPSASLTNGIGGGGWQLFRY